MSASTSLLTGMTIARRVVMWDTNVVFSWCCYFVKMLMKPSSIPIRLCLQSQQACLLWFDAFTKHCINVCRPLAQFIRKQMFHTSVGPWMRMMLECIFQHLFHHLMLMQCGYRFRYFVCELRAQRPRIADADTCPLPKAKFIFIHLYICLHTWLDSVNPIKISASTSLFMSEHDGWRKAVDMLSSITRPKINQNVHAIKSNYDYWRPTAEAHRLTVSVWFT